MPPKAVCANPLFLEWLEEAAGEAADKGSKMEFAFKKAAKSVKQCPMAFDHPEQTRQLNGVGDSIIAYLTRRLKKHCADKGDDMPNAPEPTKKLKAPSAAKKRKAPATRAQSSDNDDEDGAAGGNARAGPSAKLGGLDGLDMFRKDARSARQGGADDDGSDNDDPDFLRALDELENGPPATKKKKAAKPKKRYFPKQNSGAYAILLALHSVSSVEDMHTELSKKEIIDIAEANGWCDASFNKPKDGGFATAWNGMSTLVSKGYCIQKGSRMAKFHLSEEGFEIAQSQSELLPVDPFEQDRRDRLAQSQPSASQPTAASLRQVEPSFRVDLDGILGSKKSTSHLPSSPMDMLNAAAGRGNVSAGREAMLRASGRSTGGGAPGGSGAAKDNRFYFTYLDKRDNRVLERAKSRVKLLGDGFPHHKIELYKSQTTHSFVRSNVELLEPATGDRPSSGEETMFGWLPDDGDAPDMAVGLSRPSQPTILAHPPTSSPRPDPVAPRPGLSTLNPRPGTAFSRVNSAPAAAPATASSSRADRLAEILALATNRSQSQSSVPSSRAYSTSSATLAVPVARPTPLRSGSGSSADDGPHQRPRSSVLIESTGEIDDPRVEVDTNFRPIVWHAGSYEIVLLMDHREKSGKKGEQGAGPLRDMGVPAETSNDLVLGDITWVARRTDGGQEGGVQACVLDYIVERKRLDDLVSSIRDGRFREQKARLKSSGIGQVIYLLEKFHVGEQQDSWWSSVTTSKSSMQIIDGFFVHESDSWEGSLTYLKSMHEAIVDIHQNESLHIIPDDRIHRPTYSELQKQLRLKHPTKSYLTSVQAFKRLNSKNASMTNKDLWCKMLLAIAGLSPEKVAAIVDVYPTAMALNQAFKDAEVIERRARAAAVGQPGKPKIPLAENLLVNDIPGSNRQKIGPALSRKIYEQLRAQTYPSTSAQDD